LIISIIIIISTILIKRITLAEGLISLAVSNIILILLWSISINVLITDNYIELYKVDSISHSVEQNKINFNHNWYVYSGKHRFNILHKESNVDNVKTPNWINEEYKQGGLFIRKVHFKNIYDNLGQYSYSKFKVEKSFNKLFINTSETNYNDINDELISLAIKSKTNVYVVITNSDVKTIDIINSWNGVKLNDIIIHLTSYDRDISLSNIYTWGNGVYNKTFIRIISENLNYINLNNSDELLATIDQFIPSFSKANDQIYNKYIQSIKPDIWVIFGLILLSLIATALLLFIMIKYTRK
jgi:hypothetical protein